MKKLVTMRAALEDPQLFGTVLAGESWAAWRVLLIAVMGETLTAEERVVFQTLTERPQEPGEPVDEFWAICGRRAGKTRAIAVLGSYLAALVDFRHVLAPGERATLPIISASLWQAQKAYQYLDGVFSNVPALKRLVIGQTSDTIALSTRVDIECRPANFRTIRSGTAAAVIADEVAFWRSDSSANPDTEILNGARPSLATTGGLLACITSPYARSGEVYSTFSRDFGAKGDRKVLVAKAASRTMNPALPEDVVRRAYERDAAAAAAEYGGEFRSDVESFVDREVVEAAVVPGRFELPKVDAISYVAFVDPSGGSADSMTLAIAHREGDTGILDLICERKPPFSPVGVVSDFVEILERYGVYSVTGDRWGGEFVREQFRDRGISYEISEKPKSDIYKELLPLLNSRRIELLDSPRLVTQLCSLERRTARGGRDTIDHPAGGHDDLVNAAAGALVQIAGKPDYIATFIKAYS